MSKITVYEDVRVECAVEWPQWIKDRPTAFEAAKREAEQIAEQIRRHVDGCKARDYSRPVVKWDELQECSFCGSVWEDAPECCKSARVEWEAAHPKAVQP